MAWKLHRIAERYDEGETELGKLAGALVDYFTCVEYQALGRVSMAYVYSRVFDDVKNGYNATDKGASIVGMLEFLPNPKAPVSLAEHTSDLDRIKEIFRRSHEPHELLANALFKMGCYDSVRKFEGKA